MEKVFLEIGAVPDGGPANLLVTSDVLKVEEWDGEGYEEVDVRLDGVPGVLLALSNTVLLRIGLGIPEIHCQ